ncbi:MAG: sensor histidine kinase [Gemmatimonadota bacterium]
MRLSDFIEANIEAILTEWVAFARTQTSAEAMDLIALRDHASDMLTFIVRDLRTPQTTQEQFDKSQGSDEPRLSRRDSAAETHGAGRATSGYTVSEMVAEFRALRASVLRLWTDVRPVLSGDDLQDLMRFNESIDQALAESMARFSRNLDQSQDMFLAILTHDMRTPLQTVTMVTSHLLDTGALAGTDVELLKRAARSTRRMHGMIDDLLDFTRSRMGAPVVISRDQADLGKVARQAVDEMEVSHPGRAFALQASGELQGQWDGGRIGQVLSNLLGNAVHHGDPAAPITVRATGDTTYVTLCVHNHGAPIEPANIPSLFGPFKRLKDGKVTGAAHHLGLGLYIADRIVVAHGGRIAVESSAQQGTSFTATLPR